MVWIRCRFELNLLMSDSAIFPGSQLEQREGSKMGFLCLEVEGGDYGAGWMRSVCGCDVTAVCRCQLENKSLKKRGENTATVKPFGGGGSQTKRRPSGRWRGVLHPAPSLFVCFFTRDARHFQVVSALRMLFSPTV